MPATESLLAILSNGNGLWFAQCYWCRRSSPTHDSRDELRLLALAKAADWRVNGRGNLLGAGRFVLACPQCVRQKNL